MQTFSSFISRLPGVHIRRKIIKEKIAFMHIITRTSEENHSNIPTNTMNAQIGTRIARISLLHIQMVVQEDQCAQQVMAGRSKNIIQISTRLDHAPRKIAKMITVQIIILQRSNVLVLGITLRYSQDVGLILSPQPIMPINYVCSLRMSQLTPLSK